MVTVVDAASFLRDYARTESLAERGIDDDEDDDRTIVEVLIEQVEFCDVIVVNKTDLVSADALVRLSAGPARAQSARGADRRRFGDVPPAEVREHGTLRFRRNVERAGLARDAAC